MANFVSVIIPTHNRAKLLTRAIQSVLDQQFSDFELIIVDDASTDETESVVQQLASKDNRIRLLKNTKALGGSASRNIGIASSSGNFIAFLDDDDMWLPNKLTLQLQTLQENPNALACSAGYIVHYPFRIKKRILPPEKISVAALLSSNSLGGASVCLCQSAPLKAISGFDETLRSSQDWDVWLRLRLQGEIVTTQAPLVNYYVHFDKRISNNMRGKYQGARAFYFKHKHRMHEDARSQNLCFLSYIQSRQSHRTFFARMKHLMRAMRHSPFNIGTRYFLSSFPRMFLEPILMRFF